MKYYKYEQAIALALQQIRDGISDKTIQLDSESDTIVVMVVGAGRGPLVKASLSASHTTDIPIKIFAVEKNVNAVITLRNRCVTESWSNVGEWCMVMMVVRP